MFKKSFVYLLVMTIVVGFAFGGCRQKGAKEKKEDFTGVELTYYKMWDDSEILEPIINEYQATHPGLQIHYRKFSNFNEYQRTILNEMAEGEGPDIFSMQNTWFASNYKKISPMPEDFGTPDDFLSLFVDVAFQDLVRTDQNGQLGVMALPMTVDTLALYYNKDHFEDRIPTRGKPADTWEGIKEDVILLNKEDDDFEIEVSGIAMGRGDNISRGVDVLYLLMLQYGTEFYNDNISEAIFAGQQSSLGSSNYPGLDALELFSSFADANQKHYSWNEYFVDDDSDEKEIEAFARGKVSMIFGFAYTHDEIVNQISLLRGRGEKAIDESDIRIVQVPQLIDPDVSSDKRVTYSTYFAETVSRNSKYPRVAWDFLLELTKKKNLEYYFDKTKKPTSRRDMIEDQKKDPTYGIFASQIGYAESFPIVDYYTYKNLFTKVINQANLYGSDQSGLLEAQNMITEMLPLEGFIVPLASTEEEEDEETD